MSSSSSSPIFLATDSIPLFKSTTQSIIFIEINSSVSKFITDKTSRGYYKGINELINSASITPLDTIEQQIEILSNIMKDVDSKFVCKIQNVTLYSRMRDFEYQIKHSQSTTTVLGPIRFFDYLVDALVNEKNEPGIIINRVSYYNYDENMIYVKLLTNKPTINVVDNHTRLLKAFCLLLPLTTFVYDNDDKGLGRHYSLVELHCLNSADTHDIKTDPNKTVFESRFLLTLVK